MQVFKHDLSGYKNEFMNAKEAFTDVYAGTKNSLKASVSNKRLRNFVDSYADLEAALPNELKDNIQTLPTTDNALLLSGIPTTVANFESTNFRMHYFMLCWRESIQVGVFYV